MYKFEELPEINSERWLSLVDLEGEEWKDAVGYEGRYQVSNYGRVKSLERWVEQGRKTSTVYSRMIKARILRCIYGPYGYLIVCLKKTNKEQVSEKIHILVAKAFIPNTENKPQIDHIDTNKHNNVLYNLRWCTAKENKHNPISYKRHLEVMKIREIPIVMLTKYGEYVDTFYSVTESSRRLGIDRVAISHALRNGTCCGGFLFVYSSEYDKNKNYSYIASHNSLYGVINNTSVVVYREGVVSDVFAHQAEAARYYGVNRSMISRRCTFYNDPCSAKKKFKTLINGTDKVFNLKDVPTEDKKVAINMLKTKYPQQI